MKMTIRLCLLLSSRRKISYSIKKRLFFSLVSFFLNFKFYAATML